MDKTAPGASHHLRSTCVILSMHQDHRNFGYENRPFHALCDEQGPIVAKPRPGLTEITTHLAHIGTTFADDFE
jgi:hypothetical protein